MHPEGNMVSPPIRKNKLFLEKSFIVNRHLSKKPIH